MTGKLTAPVGVRNGTTQVANKSADQGTVIGLLAKIGDACGGKANSWTSPPAPGSDGKCLPALADAIKAFQIEWHKRGVIHVVDGVCDPGGRTIKHLIALTEGVCGPKIDKQFAAVLTRIQTDFKSWSVAQRNNACTKILLPFEPVKNGKVPTFQEIASNPTKLAGLVGLKADTNGWDVLPLFQGNAQWLRSHQVLSKSCAVPSSPKPAAGPFDPAHEDPCTCSDSVEIGGKCWLAGTVNYGAFGIMVKLCAQEFMPSVLQNSLMLHAEVLIRGYKEYINKEDPTLPIAWVRAAFDGGPTAVPAVAGNRPNCKCACSLDGGIVKWDYVWEPVKPRTGAVSPT